MGAWDELADESSVERTVSALNANGIEAIVVENGAEAKRKVLEILPEGAEVMNMTSVTLDTIGVSDEITKSGKFDSVRNKLMSMDKNEQGAEMRRLGAAPDWTVGSAHAVTEDGRIIVASATGSQLPAYVYGAGKVVWVAGTQKIVKNVDEGIRRINEYVFPLEDARSRKAYGMGSGVNKLLVVNKEISPGRIKIILVKEKLGF